MQPIAIVINVEGTIASSRFIRDVLHVYAEQFLPDYVRKHKDERDVARQLRSISDKTGVSLSDTSGLIACLQQWMRAGNEVAELKVLQGMVWEEGFRKGEFQSHVYPDVPDRLREWLEREINLYVFSTSAEKAQRLYFRYTGQGDLRLLFAGYFDASAGPATAPGTYTNLAAGVALEPDRMLYISDSGEELDAAREAGMNTLRVIRPEEVEGDAGSIRSAHAVVYSFADIDLESL